MRIIIPIIDTHTDLVIAYQDLKNKFGKATKNTQISLPLLKKANVKAVFAGYSYDNLLKNSDSQFEDMKKMLVDFKNDFELITNFNQLEQILDSTKIGIIFHLEGAAILDNKIENLIKLHQQGLRSLGLTHNSANCLGTGAVIDNTSSLTTFGRKVIKTCNQLNILVDLSHLNETGFYEAIKLSHKPVIVSHANCYAITPHPRNLKDAQLKEIANIGSVVGVFFSAKFLNPKMNPLEAKLNDAILHIDHMVQVMGINHVALGSDFGGITSGLPKGLENHTKLEKIFQKLLDKGYRTKDLEKLAYKNILRMLKQY